MFHKTNRSVLAVSFYSPHAVLQTQPQRSLSARLATDISVSNPRLTVVIMPTKTAQHCLGICTYILATHLMPRLTVLGQLLKMPIAMLAEKRFLFSH